MRKNNEQHIPRGAKVEGGEVVGKATQAAPRRLGLSKVSPILVLDSCVDKRKQKERRRGATQQGERRGTHIFTSFKDEEKGDKVAICSLDCLPQVNSPCRQYPYWFGEWKKKKEKT